MIGNELLWGRPAQAHEFSSNELKNWLKSSLSRNGSYRTVPQIQTKTELVDPYF